ncbi:rCG44969, isoform CRA_b [Rattus norvegicus]|uniref:RCG44969, isoform CRA_b n=1 Tax=Rattus norvegicus TaxID=10116 RepID=A6KJW2_RAT|nr:rCG44969, isoform CRA_b [Rattus norvegicus]
MGDSRRLHHQATPP